MSDTITDVILTGTEYQDLYDATGITVGVSIVIQNKSNTNIYLHKTASKPGALSTDGYILAPDLRSPVIVDANENGCWAKGVGPINVQTV